MLDLLVFLARQRSGLVQQAIGNGELADVVQERRRPHRLDQDVVRRAHLVRQRARIAAARAAHAPRSRCPAMSSPVSARRASDLAESRPGVATRRPVRRLCAGRRFGRETALHETTGASRRQPDRKPGACRRCAARAARQTARRLTVRDGKHCSKSTSGMSKGARVSVAGVRVPGSCEGPECVPFRRTDNNPGRRLRFRLSLYLTTTTPRSRLALASLPLMSRACTRTMYLPGASDAVSQKPSPAAPLMKVLVTT